MSYHKGLHQNPLNVGWESAYAAPGSSGLARDWRKVGDSFGEVGERAALDLGDVREPRAVQRRACFILPAASWQAIACIDGKSAALLHVQPRFSLCLTGPSINEQWSRDPIPGWHRALHPALPLPMQRGLGLGWMKVRCQKNMSRSRGWLVNVSLCLQRGLLHCPRPSGLGRQEKGCSGCQLTFLKQFMGFQSSRGVSGGEQSQLPSRWRRKAGGTRKGRKRLRPGRVETLQPINCFSAERGRWKVNKGLISPSLCLPAPILSAFLCPCLPFSPGFCKARI